MPDETTEERLRREYERKSHQFGNWNDEVSMRDLDAAYAALRAEIQRPLLTKLELVHGHFDRCNRRCGWCSWCVTETALHPEGSDTNEVS